MGGVVGNRDACGRCRTKHGGNSRLCPVHGPVGENCCRPLCKPEEWERNLYDWVMTHNSGEWIFNRTLAPLEIPRVGGYDRYDIRLERVRAEVA